MAANLSVHLPIIQCQNKANTTPFTNALPEAAGQLFAWGTPVNLNASGYVQAWDGLTFANTILGVAESFGLNLATPGNGAPVYPWGQVGDPIAIQTWGSVPNQSLAVNIALGTPTADGRTLYMEPNSDNIFEAMFDNSIGAVAADWTPTVADIGKQYGLSKDTGTPPYWYVDKGKAGASAVVQIVGIHPTDGFILNARVRFQFLTSAIQVI